jgi:hypothetical protein
MGPKVDGDRSSAALKAFEGALRKRELQFASAGSRRVYVLIPLHMMLEMRLREED